MNQRKKGGFSEILLIAYRNIYRNRRRSVLCVGAIAVSVFFIIAMDAFMDGMMENFRRQIVTFETGHVLITSREYEKKSLFMPLQYPVELPGKNLSELIEEIEGVPDVVKVFPRIRTHVSLLGSVIKNAVVWGIDMEKELPYTVFNYKTKNRNLCLTEGRYPSEDAAECAVGFQLARKMGIEIGDKIQFRLVSAEFSNKYYSPVVVGIVDFNVGEVDKNTIILPFSRAQRLATLPDSTQALYVYARADDRAETVAAALGTKYGEDTGLSIKPYTRHALMTLWETSTIMMTVIYLVFMVVASFLIVNTVIMVIHERIKEIGMMAALGMNRREIVQVFFLESLVLSGLGSTIGCLLGGITTFILSKVPFNIGAYMEDMITMNNTLFVSFSPVILGRGLLYGLLVSAVCTILPSLKSAFVKPVEALRR